MTAVNMQMLPTNVPGLDFHSLHSRSNSLSSSSTHSSHSRPQSAHGAMQRMHSGVLDDDMYRATYGLGPHQMHDAVSTRRPHPSSILVDIRILIFCLSRSPQITTSPTLLSRGLFVRATSGPEQQRLPIPAIPTASTPLRARRRICRFSLGIPATITHRCILLTRCPQAKRPCTLLEPLGE